jgi:hypothetical protein
MLALGNTIKPTIDAGLAPVHAHISSLNAKEPSPYFWLCHRLGFDSHDHKVATQSDAMNCPLLSNIPSENPS